MKHRSAAVMAAEAKTTDQHTGTPVTVAGEVIRVGKLSINQWLAITELGVGWAASMTPAERSQLLDGQPERSPNGKAKDQPPGQQGTLYGNLRSLLKEEVLLGFYSILVDRPQELLEERFDIAEFMEVLDAADQHNDLRRVWAAFSRVATRWRPPQEKPSPEATSSAGDSPSPNGSDQP